MFGRTRGRAIGAASSGGRVRSAIFVMLAVVCGLLFSQAQAQSYTFSRISVEGNTIVEPATIAKIAGIGQGATVSQAELNDAVQRLIASGLFATADVVPSGGTPVIRFTEHPAISVVSSEGNQPPKHEGLAAHA